MFGTTVVLGVRVVTSVIQLMTLLGHLTLMSGSIVRSVLSELRTGKRLVAAECARQVYECGVQTIVPVVGIALFLAIMVTVQSLFFLSAFSNTETASRITMLLILRDIGPLLTVLVIVGKAGNLFTGQIALMQANQEIDALRSVGIDPLYYVVFPRVLALTVSSTCLSVYFILTFLVGGGLISHTAFGLTFGAYVEQMLATIPLAETMVLIGKGALFGFLAGLCCCYWGLRATRALVDIPRLNSHAAFSAIALCFFWNTFLSTLLYYKSSLL